MMQKTIFLITIITLLATPSFASINITGGHMDLGLGEGDSLELHLHVHEGSIVNSITLSEDAEYAPDEAVIVIPDTTATSRSADSAWDFVGTSAGETFWVLGASHSIAASQGSPFLGIGSEIDSGVFVDNTLTLTLTGVSGPGNVCLYTESLGVPAALMASVDGLTGSDSISLETPGHAHYNFGFTEAGIFDVTFTVSGMSVMTGLEITDTATYSFHVVPEPATLSLLAFGAMGLLRRK